VGLDGLRNEDESGFFMDYLDSLQTIVDPEEFTEISEDPSSDDFHYFRGSDYDAERLSILERYKNYNGLEGNSPTSEQSNESYPTTGSTLPNVEDINRDNTLSESESYYQYHVSLRPQDLEIGKNSCKSQTTGP
jgi:cell surface protein SprA